jgi:hypothetical protein
MKIAACLMVLAAAACGTTQSHEHEAEQAAQSSVMEQSGNSNASAPAAQPTKPSAGNAPSKPAKPPSKPNSTPSEDTDSAATDEASNPATGLDELTDGSTDEGMDGCGPMTECVVDSDCKYDVWDWTNHNCVDGQCVVDPYTVEFTFDPDIGFTPEKLAVEQPGTTLCVKLLHAAADGTYVVENHEVPYKVTMAEACQWYRKDIPFKGDFSKVSHRLMYTYGQCETSAPSMAFLKTEPSSYAVVKLHTFGDDSFMGTDDAPSSFNMGSWGYLKNLGGMCNLYAGCCANEHVGN